MPACARKEIVRQGQPGIFHVSSRVVRRAFLLGSDPLSGNDYNHRRQWIKALTPTILDPRKSGVNMSNDRKPFVGRYPRLVSRAIHPSDSLGSVFSFRSVSLLASDFWLFLNFS